MKKKCSTFLLYFLLITYLELINKILMFNKLPSKEFLVVLLFSASLSFLFSFLSSLGSEKVNRRITLFLFVLTTAFYLYNFLYCSLFSVPFSIRDLELVSNALSFYEIGLHLVNTDLIPILLFLLPFILFLLYRKSISYEKKKISKKVVLFLASVILYVGA